MTKKNPRKPKKKRFPKKQSQKKPRLKIPKSLQRMKMRIKSRLLKMSFRHRRISICDLPPSTTITVKNGKRKAFNL